MPGPLRQHPAPAGADVHRRTTQEADQGDASLRGQAGGEQGAPDTAVSNGTAARTAFWTTSVEGAIADRQGAVGL